MRGVETSGFWEPEGSHRKPDWTPGLEKWGAKVLCAQATESDVLPRRSRDVAETRGQVTTGHPYAQGSD